MQDVYIYQHCIKVEELKIQLYTVLYIYYIYYTVLKYPNNLS